MIKVSIIVPVYNSEKYIRECLESLVTQKLKEIEILLIDDGSKDSSTDICEEYRKRDPRVHVIRKKNEGAGIARNAGLEIAQGEFIAFLDSDDYVDKTIYEVLYRAALNKAADASFCGSNKVEKNKIIKSGEIKDIIYDKKMIYQESIPYICSGGKGNEIKGAISVWRGIYSREIIQKYHIRFKNEREYLSEDTIFNLMFFDHANRVVFNNTHLHYQRIIPESLSRNSTPFSAVAIHNYYNFFLEYISRNENIDKQKCLQIIDRKCLEEYKSKIAREIKGRKSREEIKNDIKELCKDSVLKNILKNIKNNNTLNFKDRLFANLVKNKCYLLIKLSFKITKHFSKERSRKHEEKDRNHNIS